VAGRIAAAIGVAALSLSALASASQTTTPGQAVVHCYDEARETVQTTLPHRCKGRVVSQQEAKRITDEIRRERARRLRKQAEPRAGATRSGGVSYGSAFAVTTVGDVLTARHVVEDCDEITLATPKGERQRATIRSLSPKADIALLASELDMSPLRLSAPDDKPAPGQPVQAIGYPEQGLPLIRPLKMEGTISAYRARSGVIGFTAPVRRGASGGPLLGPDGTVIGLVIAKVNTPTLFEKTGRLMRDFNFAIAAETLRDFLGDLGVQPASAVQVKADMTAPEARVLRVICRR